MAQPDSKSQQLEWGFLRTFSSTIFYKKWHKDKLEIYQHTCKFSDKICHLHYHRHIKYQEWSKMLFRGGREGGVSPSSS